jgi:hypothetical protein
MEMDLKGKTLESQSRQIIINVHDLFEWEESSR